MAISLLARVEARPDTEQGLLLDKMHEVTCFQMALLAQALHGFPIPMSVKVEVLTMGYETWWILAPSYFSILAFCTLSFTHSEEPHGPLCYFANTVGIFHHGNSAFPTLSAQNISTARVCSQDVFPESLFKTDSSSYMAFYMTCSLTSLFVSSFKNANPVKAGNLSISSLRTRDWQIAGAHSYLFPCK